MRTNLLKRNKICKVLFTKEIYMKTVAFSGYRPEKMPFCESEKDAEYLQFRSKLRAVIAYLRERGCLHFISGVARGFDTWAAEEVLALREKDANVRLTCAVPFPEQAKAWQAEEQERRESMLSRADAVVVLSPHYTRNCFFIRNRYMVEQADVLLCAWDGKSGGTAYTVKYALQKNKTVIQIDPATAQVSIIGERGFDV